ncbi:hypothetical protein CBR_g31182 [Chara braunii]|uniref:Uncharacterized protein n=1 Tax=Chara braunii TaxID=69332 RepID=A0A388JXU4_CHABU|nr:hypothetical protein CBR_g31182 [Chara braunii]|eukprot:GBG62543.1 hypothetical protein CBR_g31182 [Chara braunii]
MGFFDFLPIVSQVESLVRVCAGDVEGARTCQVNFSRQCPVVSQVTSAVYAAQGNGEEASRVQVEFGNAMADIAGSTPVVGYVASGVAAACGDEERAKIYAVSCTKSCAIAGTGALTALTGGIGGVVVAATAGMGAGIGSDFMCSAIGSAIDGEEVNVGHAAAIKSIHQKRLEGESIVEACIGESLGVVFDGMAGVGARTATRNGLLANKKNKAIDKSCAESRPPVSREVVKGNLERTVHHTKANAPFLSKKAKGKTQAKTTGPVQCNMEGSGGTQGSGMSKNGRIAKANSELKVAQDRHNFLKEKVRTARDLSPTSMGRLQDQRRIAADTLRRAEQASREAKAATFPELSDAQPGLHRNGLNCGENPAAGPIYANNEIPVTSSACRAGKKGQVYGAERCGTDSQARPSCDLRTPGCNRYDLGAVPTDHLHGVKLNPGKKKAWLAAATCVNPESGK